MTDLPLPHSAEAERAVLGGVLLDPSCIDLVLPLLAPVDFYAEAHRRVYRAIRDLHEKHAPIDPLSVYDAAKALGGIGNAKDPDGFGVLNDLLEQTPTAANVVYWAGLVRDYSLQRRAYALCVEHGERIRAGKGDALESVAAAEGALAACVAGSEKAVIVSARDLALKVARTRAKVARGEGSFTGRPTGIPCLDEVLLGLGPQRSYVLAGRPGSGKSALGFQLAVMFARLNIGPVCWFSLEMSDTEIALRYLAAATGIALSRIQKGPGAKAPLTAEEEESVTAALAAYADLPLYVVSEGVSTPDDMAAYVRAVMRKDKADPALVGIDYAQLLLGKGETREERVSNVSRLSKSLARECRCPVLLLSQLNRPPKGSGDDREPRLDDLRESGALEQDADAVLFLWGNADADEREVSVAKQRNGPTGKRTVTFVRSTMTFSDPADAPMSRAVEPWNERSER